MPSGSTICSRRWWRSSSEAGIRVSLFIAADPDQIEAAARLRRAGDRDPHRRLVRCARRRAQRRRRRRNGRAFARAPGLRARLGLEVHAGHGLNYATAETIAALPEIVELNIGHFLVGEAVIRRACARRSGRCAPPWTAGRARADAMIIGIGSDLVRRTPHRAGDRAPRRALPRAHLHRHRARARPSAVPTGSRPMPSASPPRRPAPRRSAPGCGRACSGATWGWSTCPRGGRP